MIVNYEDEAAGFRAEVRAWLADNLPRDWAPQAGGQSPEERAKFRQEWNEKLYAAGWICASWQAEYGGQGPVPAGVADPGRGVRPGQGAAAG